MRLGKILAGWLEWKGMTQHELSDRTGISESHISKIIKGRYGSKNHCRFGTMSKLVSALGISFEEFELGAPHKRVEPKPSTPTDVAVCPHCGKPIRVEAA